MSVYLSTADLAVRYGERAETVTAWFAEAAETYRVPPYCSVDLRDAGFKVAPVDVNLFPAGFNNLTPRSLQAGVGAWRAQLDAVCPGARSVCVIPESHTRNTFYLQNVTNIVGMLRDAGYEPIVGTVDPKFVNEATHLQAADGTPLTLYKAERRGDRLVINGAEPDVILLNNDLADGLPDALRDLDHPVLPPPEVGWYVRRKSAHFEHYADVAREWAALMDVDPWCVTPVSEIVEGLDFHEPETLGPLADAVERVLDTVGEHYAAAGVDAAPYCYIKDDAGTYGMGILTVASRADVEQMNRKKRNKMDRGKANAIISRVLVQEGIPTALTVDGASAEPVLYAVGEQIIGGFRRYHPGKDALDSLNAKGAQFMDLCPPGQTDACLEEDPKMRLYGAIARISMLAAARETHDLTSLPAAPA